jgi:hypothetical protein
MKQSQLLFNSEKHKLHSYATHQTDKQVFSKHIFMTTDGIFSKNGSRLFKKNKQFQKSIIIDSDKGAYATRQFYCNVFKKHKDLEVFSLPKNVVERIYTRVLLPVTSNAKLCINYDCTFQNEMTHENLTSYYILYDGDVTKDELVHINHYFAFLDTISNI